MTHSSPSPAQLEKDIALFFKRAPKSWFEQPKEKNVGGRSPSPFTTAGHQAEFVQKKLAANPKDFLADFIRKRGYIPNWLTEWSSSAKVDSLNREFFQDIALLGLLVWYEKMFRQLHGARSQLTKVANKLNGKIHPQNSETLALFLVDIKNSLRFSYKILDNLIKTASQMSPLKCRACFLSIRQGKTKAKQIKKEKDIYYLIDKYDPDDHYLSFSMSKSCIFFTIGASWLLFGWMPYLLIEAFVGALAAGYLLNRNNKVPLNRNFRRLFNALSIASLFVGILACRGDLPTLMFSATNISFLPYLAIMVVALVAPTIIVLMSRLEGIPKKSSKFSSPEGTSSTDDETVDSSPALKGEVKPTPSCRDLRKLLLSGDHSSPLLPSNLPLSKSQDHGLDKHPCDFVSAPPPLAKLSKKKLKR